MASAVVAEAEAPHLRVSQLSFWTGSCVLMTGNHGFATDDCLSMPRERNVQESWRTRLHQDMAASKRATCCCSALPAYPCCSGSCSCTAGPAGRTLPSKSPAARRQAVPRRDHRHSISEGDKLRNPYAYTLKHIEGPAPHRIRDRLNVHYVSSNSHVIDFPVKPLAT